MAIAALPLATSRLLGSSTVVTNPTSLVKELVENSIDAGANSIEVLISQNTVDKVQVKDNGCGISLDDLNLLGRRAHTSKLRTFDELETKAGDTLGFRGEALA
ncbi:histidine kinase-like ATPase, partial [Mariannaea sp. PMI_226]